MTEFIWSSKAQTDLAVILKFEVEQRTPNLALRRLFHINKAIDRLAIWPEFGHATTKKNVRVLYAPLAKCYIFYRIENVHTILIARLQADLTRGLRPRSDF